MRACEHCFSCCVAPSLPLTPRPSRRASFRCFRFPKHFQLLIHFDYCGEKYPYLLEARHHIVCKHAAAEQEHRHQFAHHHELPGRSPDGTRAPGHTRHRYADLEHDKAAWRQVTLSQAIHRCGLWHSWIVELQSNAALQRRPEFVPTWLRNDYKYISAVKGA